MPSHSSIDLGELFDDALAVARAAPSATAGWRAICVRAQRRVGKDVWRRVSEIDLDEEVPALTRDVRRLVASAPDGITTLVFGLFDLDVDMNQDDPPGRPRWQCADPKRAFTGFHLTGLTDFDASVRWLPREPAWCPEERFFTSPALDAIAKAGVTAHGDSGRALAIAMRFGAASLLARFATDGSTKRVVVGFDDGDFAEIRALTR